MRIGVDNAAPPTKARTQITPPFSGIGDRAAEVIDLPMLPRSQRRA
jgi:hypothetical protein